MVWHRFEVKNPWQRPAKEPPVSGDRRDDYDFHAFVLEIMDVIWAWVIAGAAVLALLFVV